MLSSSKWQGIAGIVAILALIVAIMQLFQQQAGSSFVIATPTILPSATIETTPSVIETTSETLSLTTPAIRVNQYPCEGTIITEGIATVLRGVVRSSPSTSSAARGNVQVGQTVIVKRDRNDTSGGKWYEIANENGNTLGWIPTQNLRLSSNCPV